MQKSKGFTIIELLVVVAIIAVLTGIVLVNVTSYINKGKDAAIKGNMATILTNAAIVYDTTGSYATLCADDGVVSAQAAITAAGGTSTCTVAAGNGAFCSAATLKANGGGGANPDVFCVDSTGNKKTYSDNSLPGTDCPAAGACI